MKKTISSVLALSMLVPSLSFAETFRFSNKGESFNSNRTVIINPDRGYRDRDRVIIDPNPRRDIIVKPSPRKDTVIIKPSPKKVIVTPPKNRTVIIDYPNYHRWVKPIYPGWVGWRGNKVVVVKDDHDFFDYFHVFMKFTQTVILIDTVTNKPYTEQGKEVTVKKRNCDNGEETEFYELDNEVLILACK